MKQLILYTALFISTSASAQIVNHIDLKADTTIRYIQVIVMQPNIFTDNVTIQVDYGQKDLRGRDNTIQDKEGNTLKFNSAVHLLNYFTANGWDLVTSQIVTSESSSTRNTFLLIKK